MTIDWNAALVFVTGSAALVGGFAFVTRLIVRAELANLNRVFLPRKEHEIRDDEIERRLLAGHL